MRGFGHFQRTQMKRGDPRIVEFFRHVREAIDVLEHLSLDSNDALPPQDSSKLRSDGPMPELASKKTDSARLAYTIKEACEKSGVSRSTLYQTIGNKQLRAVKCGRKTLILANDFLTWVQSWPGNL
jgi:excisionase family DNA binding protein